MDSGSDDSKPRLLEKLRVVNEAFTQVSQLQDHHTKFQVAMQPLSILFRTKMPSILAPAAALTTVAYQSSIDAKSPSRPMAPRSRLLRATVSVTLCSSERVLENSHATSARRVPCFVACERTCPTWAPGLRAVCRRPHEPPAVFVRHTERFDTISLR